MNLIFSKIYWDMTAVGWVQSKWTPSWMNLRSYLSELRKKNKIHFLNNLHSSNFQSAI